MYLSDSQRQIIVSACKNYRIKDCYVFGSYVKGNATANSDLDILISSFPHWRKMLANFRNDLTYTLGMRIDLFMVHAPSFVYDFDVVEKIV